MYNLSKKKLYKPFSNNIDNPQIFHFLKKILQPESSFFWMTLIYGITLSILGLAVPISVQFLINSVSYTAMLQPLIIIGIALFVLLCFLAIISCLQFYVTEIFQRRFFTRIVSEVGLSLLNAKYRVFEEANQTEMVNRFFESITIQKTIPKFLTKTFAVIINAFVGLIVVSFYHPAFLIFSLLIIACLWLIWSKFYKNAVVTSFYESRRKYDIAGWLEDIARGHSSFKSSVGFDYAKFKLNFLSGQYLEGRKKHFKNLFSQVVLLSILYVLASVALLLIGGFLVLKEQLTIGQLVAAELILSTMLYGVANLGRDFENFYDLIAACEKLSQFYNIPHEKKGGISFEKDDEIGVKINHAKLHYLNRDYEFNLKFEAGKNYLISTSGFSTKKVLIDLIYGFRSTDTGSIEINKIDIDKLNKYEVRSQIGIVKSAALIEGTILEYLTLNQTSIHKKEIEEALKITELDDEVSQMEDGLNTRIIPSGWPFSESQKLSLQIAKILINQPKLIIITEVLDMLSPKIRKKILKYLTKEHKATIIYFSNRFDDLIDFDEYLFIDKNSSHKFNSIEELHEFTLNF
jgi:ABC-type bacteriocin/lantibiotic exporter with double-glycine peptidase domain